MLAADRQRDANLEVLRGRDMLCFGHDWSGDPLSGLTAPDAPVRRRLTRPRPLDQLDRLSHPPGLGP